MTLKLKPIILTIAGVMFISAQVAHAGSKNVAKRYVQEDPGKSANKNFTAGGTQKDSKYFWVTKKFYGHYGPYTRKNRLKAKRRGRQRR